MKKIILLCFVFLLSCENMQDYKTGWVLIEKTDEYKIYQRSWRNLEGRSYSFVSKIEKDEFIFEDSREYTAYFEEYREPYPTVEQYKKMSAQSISYLKMKFIEHTINERLRINFESHLDSLEKSQQ